MGASRSHMHDGTVSSTLCGVAHRNMRRSTKRYFPTPAQLLRVMFVTERRPCSSLRFARVRLRQRICNDCGGSVIKLSSHQIHPCLSLCRHPCKILDSRRRDQIIIAVRHQWWGGYHGFIDPDTEHSAQQRQRLGTNRHSCTRFGRPPPCDVRPNAPKNCLKLIG